MSTKREKVKKVDLITLIKSTYAETDEVAIVRDVIKKIRKNAKILNECDNAYNTPLILATNRDFEAMCYALVEKGADINQSNLFGLTPVIWACEVGNKNLAKYYVERGADINSRVPLYNPNQAVNDLSNSAGPLACCVAAAAGTARADKHARYIETADYLLSLCHTQEQAHIFRRDIDNIHSNKKNTPVFEHTAKKLDIILEKFELTKAVGESRYKPKSNKI